MYTQIDNNEIKLYGTIWGGDGTYISSELTSFFKKAKDPIVRLHSPGGSVIDGNLIYNALVKNSFDVIIDGIAASMGSVLMLPGKKIKMVENGFIMIHQPRGTVDNGDAKAMRSADNILTSMEKNFLKKFAAKTGKPAIELAYLMEGDNWFSAEQALELGLIDEIIDPVLDIDASAVSDLNMVAVAGLFEAWNHKPTQEPVTPQNPPNKMKLSAQAIVALGLKEDATEAQINAAVEKQASDLVAANKKAKDIEDAADIQLEANAETLVAKGIKEGRFLAADKDDYKALALSNFALAEKTINKLPVKRDLTAEVVDGKPNANADEKSFDWWRKNDPAALIKIKNEDPERYAAIQKVKTEIK